MTATASPETALADGRLDLWLVRPPKPEPATEPLDLSDLDDAERRRAASFIRPLDGLTYACAHIALRRLLGAYLGVPPGEVEFVRDPCPGCAQPHGRPAVPAPPPHFSLSHSHGMALIGLAATPVGVDVERLPRDSTVEVCVPALHPDERAELDGLPSAELRGAFGQLWTRKEAYLKGIGTGLSRDPAKDYLGADPSRRPPGWTVLDVPCGPRHNAAVAVLGAAPASTTIRRLPMECLYSGGAVDLHVPAIGACKTHDLC